MHLNWFLLLSFAGCSMASILPPGPLQALLGKNVTFKLNVVINATDQVVWKVENDAKEQVTIASVWNKEVTIEEPYKGRAFLNAANGFLTLTSLQISDSRDYIVIVAPKILSATIELKVFEPVSNVLIKANPTEALEHNSSVTLICTAKGSYLDFTWLRNSEPIKIDNDRLSVSSNKDEPSSSLVIRDVTRSDFTPPIICQAKNALENEKSAPFTMTLFYGPEAVTVTVTKEGEFVESKSDYNLTCSTPSVPPAVYTWYFNKEKMDVTGPVLTLKTIEDKGFGKKGGQYSCWAQNSKTRRTAVSTPIKLTVMERIQGTKVTYSNAVLIAGNGTANLTCKAAGGQVMETLWEKDQMPLTTSSRVKLSDDKSNIVIDPVSKDDNGKYTCRLKNSINQEEDSYTLVVNYGPENAKVEGKNEIEVATPLKLTCNVMSIPPPKYTWKLNSTVLSSFETSELTIKEAKYTDSGTYTCEVFNAVTGLRTSSKHSLSVKEEIVEGLSDGAIAGIIIACLIVAIAVSVGLFIYCRSLVPMSSPYEL